MKWASFYTPFHPFHILPPSCKHNNHMPYDLMFSSLIHNHFSLPTNHKKHICLELGGWQRKESVVKVKFNRKYIKCNVEIFLGCLCFKKSNNFALLMNFTAIILCNMLHCRWFLENEKNIRDLVIKHNAFSNNLSAIRCVLFKFIIN